MLLLVVTFLEAFEHHTFDTQAWNFSCSPQRVGRVDRANIR